MVTLVICSVLLMVVSQNFTRINRVIQSFINHTTYRDQYLIFLLKFEEDYHRTDYFSEEDLLKFDQLKFSFDLNLDGDQLDSGENIEYRWNAEENRIDRKSGKGSFQAYLENVSSFGWSRISRIPLCYRMTTKSHFSHLLSESLFCRGN